MSSMTNELYQYIYIYIYNNVDKKIAGVEVIIIMDK